MQRKIILFISFTRSSFEIVFLRQALLELNLNNINSEEIF